MSLESIQARAAEQRREHDELAEQANGCREMRRLESIAGLAGFPDGPHDDGQPTFRRFHLVRDVDVSGVSGTGVVAEGVAFTDGTACLRWCSAWKSTAVYEAGMPSVEAIHGHDGATRIVWLDQPAGAEKGADVQGPDGANMLPMPERLWPHVETARFLGLPPATLHQLNHKGTGPRSFRVGRHRRYDPSDVRLWLEGRASDRTPAA